MTIRSLVRVTAFGVALLGAALAALWALNGWWLGHQARLRDRPPGRD